MNEARGYPLCRLLWPILALFPDPKRRVRKGLFGSGNKQGQLVSSQTLSGDYNASGIMQESDLCGVDLGLRASGEWDVHKPPVYGSSP